MLTFGNRFLSGWRIQDVPVDHWHCFFFRNQHRYLDNSLSFSRYYISRIFIILSIVLNMQVVWVGSFFLVKMVFARFRNWHDNRHEPWLGDFVAARLDYFSLTLFPFGLLSGLLQLVFFAAHFPYYVSRFIYWCLFSSERYFLQVSLLFCFY